MKPIKCDLPAELDSIELYDLADFHIGDMMCDFKLVQALINHVKDTPNAYCILGGDLMDSDNVQYRRHLRRECTANGTTQNVREVV